MKTRILTTTAAAILALNTATYAGGMAEPVVIMEPVEIIEETPSSSAGLIVPLIIVALIAVASSSSSDTPVFAVSDARLKTGITPVGTAPNGLPLYQYSYIGSEIVFEGVMAQEVLQHTPEAVTMTSSGHLAVNYQMLGLELKVIH